MLHVYIRCFPHAEKKIMVGVNVHYVSLHLNELIRRGGGGGCPYSPGSNYTSLQITGGVSPLHLKHWYDVILCSFYPFYFLKRQKQSNNLPVAVQ
jgi:hypothetical protein